MNRITIHNFQMKKKTLLTVALGSALGLCTATSFAEEKTADNESDIERIITMGTRVSGRTVTDSAVPIDLISAESLTRSGFTELGQSLQAQAPSFNFSRTQVSDGTDLFRPATLRGLQPDQTLVLINGKRRHTQSIFGNQSTVGGGSAGTDMNSIPMIALQRVEILRDGAAAQYGSDAIAGVINLQLKDTTDETTIFVQWGETTEGDGAVLTTGINTGFELGSDGGFINLSGEFRDFDSTNRADNPLWHQGDPEGEFGSFFYNSLLPIGNGEIYSFGGYSKRTALGSGFRRQADSATQNVPQVYPEGFTPNIDNEAIDFSSAIGYRQEINDEWSIDVSTVYGKNEYEFASVNTINASIAAEYLFNNPLATDEDILANSGPTSGKSATFSFDQATFNVDVYGEIDLGNEPLYISFGTEYRNESYDIGRGSLESYSCGSSESLVTFPSVIDPSKFAECGFQAYSGISPSAETNTSRNNYSVYVDLERYVAEDLLVEMALRFEDYGDIGSKTIGKVSSSYKLTEDFSLRGAIATGFRAPSLPQRDYNAYQANVNANGDIALAYTAASGSDLPVALGIEQLDLETSTSISAGFIWDLAPLTITLDAYKVKIDDRVALGSDVTAEDLEGNQEALDALEATGVESAKFFSNAINTTTEGADLIIDYETDFMGGVLDVNFSANLNETKIDSFNLPVGITADQVFSTESQKFITGGQPKKRGNLTLNWSKEQFSSLLRIGYFGETEVDFFAANHIGLPGFLSPTGEFKPTSIVGSAVLVDIDFSYHLSDALTLSIGGNNIFDTTPDELGEDEVLDFISGGAFRYPLRAVPYGFNGASYYLKASYKF